MSEVATEATMPVSVTVVPGRTHAAVIPDDGTVRDALEAAGVSAEGMQIRVGGEVASLDTPLSNERNRVFLSRQVKGN